MKYKGRQVTSSMEEIVPIIRTEGTIYLTVKTVKNIDRFEKLCPKPKTPTKLLPGGRKVFDDQDKFYIHEIALWGSKQGGWLLWESLKDSEIEFETIDPSNAETFANVLKELQECFLESEFNRILNAFYQVNGLNENMINEARHSFLASREEGRTKPDSPTVDLKITPTGELANVPDSPFPDTSKQPVSTL